MENIVRLRKANEEKRKLVKRKATQGVPKNYTGKNTSFKPFNLNPQGNKNRGSPITVIEVTISPGKTGNLENNQKFRDN